MNWLSRVEDVLGNDSVVTLPQYVERPTRPRDDW
jgi:hypothetical protein